MGRTKIIDRTSRLRNSSKPSAPARNTIPQTPNLGFRPPFPPQQPLARKMTFSIVPKRTRQRPQSLRDKKILLIVHHGSRLLHLRKKLIERGATVHLVSLCHNTVVRHDRGEFRLAELCFASPEAHPLNYDAAVVPHSFPDTQGMVVTANRLDSPLAEYIQRAISFAHDEGVRFVIGGIGNGCKLLQKLQDFDQKRYDRELGAIHRPGEEARRCSAIGGWDVEVGVEAVRHDRVVRMLAKPSNGARLRGRAGRVFDGEDERRLERFVTLLEEGMNS